MTPSVRGLRSPCQQLVHQLPIHCNLTDPELAELMGVSEEDIVEWRMQTYRSLNFSIWDQKAAELLHYIGLLLPVIGEWYAHPPDCPFTPKPKPSVVHGFLMSGQGCNGFRRPFDMLGEGKYEELLAAFRFLLEYGHRRPISSRTA